MGSRKNNPNDLQIEEAKSTDHNHLEKAKSKEYNEIQKKKPKKVEGTRDEGVADEQPFDARSNNMHQKR